MWNAQTGSRGSVTVSLNRVSKTSDLSDFENEIMFWRFGVVVPVSKKTSSSRALH